MPFTGKPEAEYVGAHLVSGFKILATAAQERGNFLKVYTELIWGLDLQGKVLKKILWGKRDCLVFEIMVFSWVILKY